MMDYALQVLYKTTNRYPSKEEFVALMMNENIEFELCPRHAMYKDMEGVFLGQVIAVRVPDKHEKGEVMLSVKVCEANPNKLNKTTIEIPAQETVVLDVYLSNGEKELVYKEFEVRDIQLIQWLCTHDTYSGQSLLFEDMEEVIEAFYEILNEPVPMSFLLRNANVESNSFDEPSGTIPVKAPKNNLEQEKQFDEWLFKDMPQLRQDEYQMTYESAFDLHFWMAENPMLFNGGNSLKIAIVTDCIFDVDSDNNKLYVNNFAREFMIACCYLGAEITVISTAPTVSQKMLDAADIPYHDILNKSFDITAYNYIIPTWKNFNGFCDAFQHLYGKHLPYFHGLVGKSYDVMREVLNGVYNSEFGYDSFLLTRYCNELKYGSPS